MNVMFQNPACVDASVTHPLAAQAVPVLTELLPFAQIPRHHDQSASPDPRWLLNYVLSSCESVIASSGARIESG